MATTTTTTGLLADTYQPTAAQASTYTADQWQVDAPQTVQGQVNQIIAKDSPLMQQAATTAKQAMNGKGLLNTSMAVGAGQNAVIGAAMPMATQDAATNANAAQFNAGASNQAAQFNAQQGNQFKMADVQQANDLTKLNTQYSLDTAQKVQLANLSTASAERLAGIEAQYKQLNQASASATSVMNTTMTAIARIMEDTTLDAAAKQTAIDTYNNNAATSLNLIAQLGGDVDVSAYIQQLTA